MAVLFALQFVSVAFFIVMGTIYTVTNLKFAWAYGSNRSELGIWTNGAVGVALLGVAVFLAAFYGWIPGIA